MTLKMNGRGMMLGNSDRKDKKFSPKIFWRREVAIMVDLEDEMIKKLELYCLKNDFEVNKGKSKKESRKWG